MERTFGNGAKDGDLIRFDHHPPLLMPFTVVSQRLLVRFGLIAPFRRFLDD